MIEIRLLRPDDDRSSFLSGNADLDRFFHKYAGQNQFRTFLGVTWVAVEGSQLLGFATIAASSIEIDDLPASKKKKLPAYPLPVLRLARLAVDHRVGKKGVGKLLLRAVLEETKPMAKRYGCIGVVVDAKTDAVGFYEKLGFEPMDALEGGLQDVPGSVPLFLPLGRIPA